MGDFTAARIAFTKASRLLVDDYRAWGNLADTLAALGEVEAARAGYRRALDRTQLILAQNTGDYHAKAAAASFRSALQLAGWHDDVMEALAMQPDDPEIHRLAALSYLRAGRTDRAKVHYAEALNLGYPEFLLTADYQLDALREAANTERAH
jgi:Flp pilus assembly protein TadD